MEDNNKTWTGKVTDDSARREYAQLPLYERVGSYLGVLIGLAMINCEDKYEKPAAQSFSH